MKDKAFEAIDKLLWGLKDDTIPNFCTMDPYITSRTYYYYFTQVLEKYHLIGYCSRIEHKYFTRVHLAENGMRAIEAGGIREYMITYDKHFVDETGYPKLFVCSVKGGQKIKRMAYDNGTFLNLKFFYGDPGDSMTLYEPRGEKSRFNPKKQPTPIPQTVINNHIAGSVENLQNNGRNIETNSQGTRKQNPTAEGRWTKTGVGGS